MMGSSRPLLAATLLAGAVAGCATLYGGREPDPEERLAQALNALEREDYRTAFDGLVWVYSHYPTEPVGQQALLALAAAEMDPRNPSRRLGVGSELAASYLGLPATPNWTEPVAETLYLLALELGAAEMRVARAEAEREQAEAGRARARIEARQAQAETRRAEVEAQRAEVEAQRAEAEARQARGAAEAAPPRPLPRLPGPPVTARMRELERERDRLAGRVTELERELERIRRTLRP